MSRVKRNRKRKLRSEAVLRLAAVRTRANQQYGMIELGLQGIGPRRPAKMALAADSRPPC